MKRFAIGVAFAALAMAQAPPNPKFEVASIRASQPVVAGSGQAVNVGLRMDGSQARITGLTLGEYVAMAYRVKAYQVSGPDFLSTRFDLNAKLPDGAKTDQIPEMLQPFLAERFGLKFHRAAKELPVYVLEQGKTPLKLEKSVPSPAGTEREAGVNIGATGSADGVSVNMGNGSYYTFKDNKFEIKKVTMTTLAALLERYVDRPLLDMTNLPGEYDLTVNITDEDYRTMLIRAAVNSGVTLPPQALRLLDSGSIASLIDGLQQLGLKLDARKAPLDTIIIDQISKTPTDN